MVEYLFNKSILKDLDYTNCEVTIKHSISFDNPGTGLSMRPLCRSDHAKGYMDLLSQLTQVGNTSEGMFIQRFDGMKDCKNSYYVVVIEDEQAGRIAASGTLTVEQQLNPSLDIKSRGRIEDIVVLNTHRGKYLGKLLLETLALIAKYVDCDDLSLECKDPLVRFYHQFGFIVQDEQVYMGNRYLH